MYIELKNVAKIYKSGEIETKALKGVSLEIDKGEFVVVLGPSGSGKTTLLNLISGLDTATSGSIRVKGEELTGYTSEQLTDFRRKNLGFVFQQYNLLSNLTVYDNVLMGADISVDPLDVDMILDKVGLQEQKHKYPYQLSGGEQQRVSVARSIAKNPEILFCDEPTGSLDEATAKQVLEVLEELNREYNITMVIITHNPGIGAMADKIVRMNSGNIEEIRHNDHKKKANDVHWG